MPYTAAAVQPIRDKVKDRPPRVSVVVPIYKNRDTLEALFNRLENVFRSHRLSYELIGVVDACPEQSGAEMKRLAGINPRVTAIHLPRNVGQQKAVMTGLAHAGGDYIVIMDADLQDSPEATPALLAFLERGFGAVFAGRRGEHQSGFRMASSRLFKTLLHLLCGVPKDAGLFVGISRCLKDRLLLFKVRKPYVLGMIGCTGLPMISTPVPRSPRPSGKSAYTAGKRLKAGADALGTVLAIKWRQRDIRRPEKGLLAKAALEPGDI